MMVVMKQTASFHRIKRIEVTGGFLIGLNLEFDAGLNCLIGPRGTGKSSVLELLRYALDIMPGREGDPLRRRVESIIENNLEGGRVEVTIETKEGLTYIVSRASGEDPVLLDDEHNPMRVAVTTAQLFSADIYSQNQIENIAETPHYQLDLIDGFEEEKLRETWQRIAGTMQELQANATQIQPLVAEKEGIDAALLQLDLIREKLKGYAAMEGQDAEAINKAHQVKALRDRESKAVRHATDAVQSQSDRIRELMGRVETKALGVFTEDMLSGPNGKPLSEQVAKVRTAIRKSEEALKSAAALLDDAAGELASFKGVLDQAHVPQELAFRTLIEKQQQNQAQSAERAKLEKQQNDLLFKQVRLNELVSLLKALHERRDELLARLSEERDLRFGLRDKVAARLNDRLMPYIKVSVAQNADQEVYREFLEENLRGIGIQQKRVAASISHAISPEELGELVKTNDPSTLTKRGGINPQQAAVVIKALGNQERLMELQVLDMEDLPSIELCDNGIYKSTADLSTGQKCTAILPILMFDSANPLLIDQPEDNLDNRFVFDTIVGSVNAAKETRQLIFVTHNPNIPVLGDAEKVVVMQSDGRAGKTKIIGDVDTCRDEIIDLLEGGAEAFRLRSEKYGVPSE
jgi:ABC-type lipoprotein export system ATPase subunit